jgi:hypothetical protein
VSQKVDERKPLAMGLILFLSSCALGMCVNVSSCFVGGKASALAYAMLGLGKTITVIIVGRGLHWSTFRLNVSAFCGMGGALRGDLGGD